VDCAARRNQDGDLFALPPEQLAAACRLDTSAVLPGSHQERLITRALPVSARLVWHCPLWAHPHPGARWWIVFHGRMAAPVAWEPDTQTPLVILGLADHRPLLIRWLSRLRTGSRTSR
jgi:hypothetical protein